MARKDIEELEIYQNGMQIGKYIYDMIMKWDQFNKSTIGYQLIRAADSIAANISEGYGRFHYKEQRQFCYIARGSLYETRTWLKKAYERVNNENDQDQINDLLKLLNSMHVSLNAYIKYIERNL